MADMKMIRIIEIMKLERARFSQTHDLDIPENAEIDLAYKETVQLLESFNTRSGQILRNLRAYGRVREPKKAGDIDPKHFQNET